MGRYKSPGLQKRGRIWWIDKKIKGYGRLAESCGTNNLEEAERYLAHRINEVRQAVVYGIRPTRTFEQAVVKYLNDYQHKKSLERDIYAFMRIMPHIGDLTLDRIHNDTLAQYRQARRADGVTAGTINKELSCIRRILNLAARVWRHDNGISWLDSPPLIEMEQGPVRQPYPLSWEEQDRLFKELPGHLQRMALYKVNTGCREQEVCQLRWNWEVNVPELETSVFVLPSNEQFRTKKPAGASCRAELDCPEGDRRTPGKAPGVRVHLQRQAAVQHAQLGLAAGEGAGRAARLSRTRPSPYDGAPAACCWRVLRGSSGFTRSLVRADHDALLGTGHCKTR